MLAPEQAPPVVVLRAQLMPSREPDLARYRVSWELASGSASHFLVAVNPASADVVDGSWQSTREPGISIAAPRRGALSASRREPASATHLVVRAVDRRGRMSPPARLSFIGDNLAPEVRITSPVPTSQSRAYLPSGAVIRWEGVDPDGSPRAIPEIFKWKLIGPGSEVSYQTALVFPDSVRRFYEPGGYADWDSVSAAPRGEGSAVLSDLTLGADYIFVVVARDAAGSWNPVFSLDSNMLNFRCVRDTQGGPVLTVYNESFYYQYPFPSYATDPRFEIPLTLPSGVRVPIHWFGVAGPGAEVAGYRWALDLTDLSDPAEAASGLRHPWSPLGLETTSATVGPFGPGETHRLFVEARDSNGLRSLGIVRIEVLSLSAQRPLLVVNDTRFALDQRTASAGCVNPPVGRWPTAAELDSFLFARGGVPWRCYPAGTLSRPGIFAGYDYDTLGTRSYPGGVIPLSLLGRYERVLWLTDALGALNTAPLPNLANRITALREMTKPGSQNTLAEYARSGGRIWVAGGGGGFASTASYNRLQNDGQGTGVTFSSLLGELGPGRFAYDVLGWRSEFKVSRSPITLTRWLGRYEGAGTILDGAPLAMRARTSSSDPYPPGRAMIPGNFYYNVIDLEYLSTANEILNRDTGAANGSGGSALDSLYRATGPALVPPGVNPSNVAMTRYHGAFRNNPVLFTGFDLWSFQRTDCKALVDFVLQRLWGMSPSQGGGGMARAEH